MTDSPNIVVLDGQTLNPGDNPWDAVSALGRLTVYDRTPADQIVTRARDAQVVLNNKTPLAAQTIEQLPQLRFIGVLATGFNIVDVAAARRRAIPVSNVPEYSTESVAQLVFALLLEHCHHIGLHDSAVKAGEWTKSVDFCFWKTPLVELAGLTMGIFGFGRIGRRVGELAHAFGMNVLAHSRKGTGEPAYQPFRWASVEELFAESDVVSLHTPLTDAIKGMVNRKLLSRMKPSAVLINTARGGLVNEQDLADALRAGRPGAAAVDVVGVEPIAAGNPLLSAPNCIITPHIAWATLAARRRLMAATARNVAAFLAGKPINVVN